MSSRAIRKLQKLREQELQHSSDQEDDSTDDNAPHAKPTFNAFDLLNAGLGDEGGEESEPEENEEDAPLDRAAPEPARPRPPKSASKKKKKKAKKTKAQASAQDPKQSNDAQLDEIDRALKDLNVKAPAGADFPTTTANQHNNYPKTTSEVLSIEPKHLNATNEMRKLFGNVVLENFEEDTGPRRPSRGKSLKGTKLRRNALMQGHDDWPFAPSGGLGMIVDNSLSPNPDCTVYRIVHNTAYKDVQNQFDMCVESMEPQRLISLLQYNPYHISTLLQVSELAKHQGDHSVAADLLERALFNIGRSAHSSFEARLKEGQARLDFSWFGNRELWLAGWRYIANLAMKGTWRTAYEWSKLLLGLNDSDPYCMRLLIDHLVLRGREYAEFVEMCTKTRFVDEWADLPNIQCSLVIAYMRLNKPQESRQQLRHAMSCYPWIFTRLAQELDFQHIPKEIWGVTPPDQAHELLTELYILRAKDLWNTPEAVSLVVEVADTLTEKVKAEAPAITLDIARHVILSDKPSVTAHVPPRFFQGRMSASDPLPPPSAEPEAFHRDGTRSDLAARLRDEAPEWVRNLLMQMDLRAPRAGPRPDGDEWDFAPPEPEANETDDDEIQDWSDEHSDAHAIDLLARGLRGDQQALLRWLDFEGLEALEMFLLEFGVDRGNWNDVDRSPLMDYLEALQAVRPESVRVGVLRRIQETIGSFARTILENELQMLEDGDYEAEDSL
ncbi:hypothetical protein N7470_009852 [Penicillium chermesinum]|nr:hypothetical protein N7470_009852 [Penicillium chermesinum]